MTSVNSLQTTLHNLYAQLNNDVPYTKAAQFDANALHTLGLNAGLLQNLRQDLSAVNHGANPDRALNNLISGLRTLLPFNGAQNPGSAQEWPAGKEVPAGTRYKDFMKGEDGQPKELTSAQEWPAGKEVPAGTRYKDFMKGEDGQPKELISAQELPAGKEVPAGTRYNDFTKGEDGQPKELTSAQELPATKEIPAGTQFKDLMKGEDGQPKEVEASEAQRSALGDSNSSVQLYADATVSALKTLLDAEAAGTDIAQASASLRSALHSLFDNTALASNPEQVRDALRNSIRSQA